MASENVELLQAAFAAYNEDGPEAIIALIAPKFEAVIPPSLSVEPDTYTGPEGMRRYFELFADVMDEVGFIPQEFIDAGDKVVVPMRVVARARETGLEVEQLAVQVWTMRDGRALRVEAFPTKADALRAAGIEDDAQE